MRSERAASTGAAAAAGGDAGAAGRGRAEPDRALRPDPATTRLLAAAVLAALLALLAHTTYADPDMFHELSLAREALDRGTLPRDDVFAFTPTRSPAVHHEWGFGVLLLALLRAAGPPGVLLLRYAIVLALFFGALHLSRRRGARVGVLAAAALPTIAMVGIVDLGTLRAQTPTLLLALVTLGMIERDRDGGRRWMLAWFPMQLVWQNLHGGFVVGPGLIALHALEQALRRRPWRHLAGLLALSAVMVPMQPWGLDYPRFLARALTLHRAEITEWWSIAHTWWPIQALFVASLAVAAIAWRGAPKERDGALLLLATALLAARHQRHLALYAVVFATQALPWLHGLGAAAALDRVLVRRRFAARFLTSVAGLAFVGLFAAGRPWRLPVPANPGDHPRVLYPVGAVDHLRDAAFRGRLFTPFASGAYVSWRLHPDVSVSLDGRYEVAYADGVLEDHLAVLRAAPGWEEALARISPDLLLVPRRAPVTEALRAHDGFAVAYEDDAYLLWAPTSGGDSGPPIDARGRRFDTTFPVDPRGAHR